MIKNIIFVCLAIVILLHKLHKTVLIRNEQYGYSKVFIWWKIAHSRNCRYVLPEFSFQLNYCNNYQIGSRLTLIGREVPSTDKRFFGPKRLTVHEVAQRSFSKSSVNDWFELSMNVLLRLKERSLEEIARYLPEPQGSLAMGMVFGGSQALSDEFQQDLKITGLTHVVSASGYNVSVVVGSGLWLAKRLSRVLKTIIGLTLIASYACLAGLVPPVVRAAVMSSLALWGSSLCFRRTHPAYLLLLTVIGLLYFEPWYLKSLSFWLSVTATAGIVLFLPHLERSLEHFSVWSMKETFLTTLAAQLLTIPLVLVTFGEASFLSLVTNTLLLWLTPFITLSGLTLVLVSILTAWWPLLYQGLMVLGSLVVWLPSQLFMTLVSWAGQFEGGMVRWQMPWWLAGGWYTMLVVWYVASIKKNHA